MQPLRVPAPTTTEVVPIKSHSSQSLHCQRCYAAPCGGAEQQQLQQAAAVRNRLHRVAVDEGALQEALVQSIDAVHAAAALGVQHSMLPDGRGNGLAAWRQ